MRKLKKRGQGLVSLTVPAFVKFSLCTGADYYMHKELLPVKKGDS